MADQYEDDSGDSDSDGTPDGGGAVDEGMVHEPPYSCGELCDRDDLPFPCINPNFKSGSRNNWFYAIKVLGYIEFLLSTLCTIVNFVAYIMWVFLAGLTTLGDHFVANPVAPAVYYGIMYQLFVVWGFPLFNYVHKWRTLYLICDESRGESLRFVLWIFSNIMTTLFMLFQASGYFGSIGVFQTIRIPLFILTAGVDLSTSVVAFIIVAVSGLIITVGYIFCFLLTLFVLVCYFVVKCEVFQTVGYAKAGK